jgi:initiation factor 1A
MVKNAGGNKAKKMGRKFISTSNLPQKTRFAYEEGEIYAVCNKIFGGGMCDVLCIDGSYRLCIIRNKFRGRGKRDNTIQPGKWLLVGAREFESKVEGKKEKCDLLEVYNENDQEKLKQQQPDYDWKMFNQVKMSYETKTDDEVFAFGDTQTMEYQDLIDKGDENVVAIDSGEKVNIDDI